MKRGVYELKEQDFVLREAFNVLKKEIFQLMEKFAPNENSGIEEMLGLKVLLEKEREVNETKFVISAIRAESYGDTVKLALEHSESFNEFIYRMIKIDLERRKFEDFKRMSIEEKLKLFSTMLFNQKE